MTNTHCLKIGNGRGYLSSDITNSNVIKLIGKFGYD